MKKAIISPVCSGLVIPGLGQIINQDLKKGILLLAGVFVLFIAGIVKLVRIIRSILELDSGNIADPEAIMAKIRAEDPTLLWVIGALFAILWIVSVVDAYVKGRHLDSVEDGDAMR